MKLIANAVYLYWFIALGWFIIFHLLGIVRTDWDFLRRNKLKGFKLLFKTIASFPISIIENITKEPEEWIW